MPQVPANATPFQQQVAQEMAQIQAAVASIMNAGAGGGGPATIPSFPTKLIVPFTYLIPLPNIAAGSQGQVNLTMAADSVFELLRIMVITSADNATDYAPNNCSISWTDGSTGQLLTSGQIPQAMFGTRSYQFGSDEKYPIQFPAQAQVNFTANNLLSSALTVNIALKGYKIFQKSPAAA